MATSSHPLPALLNQGLQAWDDLVSRISALTLGQIWSAVNYHPFPRPVNLAILAIVLVAQIPRLTRWWATRTRSRRVVRFRWPVPKEVTEGWTGRALDDPGIFAHEKDDKLLPPEAGRTGSPPRKHLTCYDPATGFHLTTLPLLTAEEVSEQILRAHKAQPRWAKTTWAQRQSFLRSLKAWVLDDMEGIVRVACRDTGKTKVDAVFGEILTTLSKIDWLLKYGEKTLSPEKRPTTMLLAHKVSKVHYQPLGTTLALVSWNYSFHNLLSPLLASLFAGNSCVIKCSEQVAWSSAWFFGGVRTCLEACGHDPEVIQLVICLPEVAETVTRNPLVKHITFIGSEPVGRKVAAAAADIMVPTCIELGGKDPAFLLPSADIDFFASTFLRGAFQSAGQNCIGIELFLVPRSLYPRFLSLIAPRVSALRTGLDVGSLISHTPIPRLESILDGAVTQGSRILAGGKKYHHPGFPQGAYFEPTLIVDVTMDMEVARTELFAPVMTVVPYDDVDEAIMWLNRGKFGLGGGVYGANKKECESVAERLECGMVAINDFGVFYLNQAMPFGGVKASGHGRFGGPEGLRSLCHVKAITEDRLFSLIRTPIPGAVDFPLPPDSTSWGFLRGLVRLAYDPRWWYKLWGLGEVLQNASG